MLIKVVLGQFQGRIAKVEVQRDAIHLQSILIDGR